MLSTSAMVPSPVLGALARLEQALSECAPAPDHVLEQLHVLRTSVERWTHGHVGQLQAPSHGRWIRTPAGVHVDLRRRRALRRLVSRLVSGRVSRPGQPLSVQELLLAGWPDERLKVDAGLNRLYVALTRLRGLGLEDILMSASDGWLISPIIDVDRCEDDVDRCEDDAPVSCVHEHIVPASAESAHAHSL